MLYIFCSYINICISSFRRISEMQCLRFKDVTPALWWEWRWPECWFRLLDGPWPFTPSEQPQSCGSCHGCTSCTVLLRSTPESRRRRRTTSQMDAAGWNIRPRWWTQRTVETTWFWFQWECLLSLYQGSPRVPWVSILTSRPVWAYILFDMSFAWTNYMMLSDLPTYLKNVLHFDVQQVANQFSYCVQCRLVVY